MAERQVAKKEAEEAAEEAEEAEEEAAKDEARRMLRVLIDAVAHTSARARPCVRPRPPEVFLVSRL
jgi:hypothetical protein